MNATTRVEQGSLQAADKPMSSDAKARLGAITRELHDALRALGAAPELQRVIREIPDARSRLSYVGEMTEKAALRVLNLVDGAMPKLAAHGQQAGAVAALIERQAARSAQDAAGDASVMDACGKFASDSALVAAEQQQTLSEIMLTQDFQDLSGQVIKKVIDMITRTERQLVALLIDDGEFAVADAPVDAALQGPQTPETALAQDDVDDLLASMGF